MPQDTETQIDTQSLLEALPLAAALIDNDGNVAAANATWLGRVAASAEAYPCVAAGASWSTKSAQASERGVAYASALSEAASALLSAPGAPFSMKCECSTSVAGFASIVEVRLARVAALEASSHVLVTVAETGSASYSVGFDTLEDDTIAPRYDTVAGKSDEASASWEAAHAAFAERSRSLFDAVPAALFVFRMDTLQLIAANRAAADRTGWTRSELSNANVRDLLDVSEHERLAHSVTLPGGRSLSRGHWTFRCRDESQFIGDAIVSDMLYDGHKARIVMFRDVTAERAIAADLRLLREGVARLNDVLVMTGVTPAEDGSLRITFVNEAFERRTGWTHSETIGQTTAMLDGPATSFDTLNRIRGAIARREPIREEILQYTKDGSEYWVELDATPIFDAQGEHTHWIAVHRDITDRRRLEDQLFQAQKMDAVGRLAGGVAHDFNNVLTAISGFSELLLEELPVGSEPHDEVLQIKAAADRATSLTRQLLAFSRKQILRPRRLDLNAQVQQMEPFIRRVISAEVAIRTTFALEVPAIYADPVQLEQVLLNLVVNASEAMADGGMLNIETGNTVLSESYASRHHGVTPGRYACLIVSDNGVGMDRRTRDRAFEPFFTTKSGGTGLGLSTVYGIVQQSGGHVWVYSEPGVGTTFKIYLPMATQTIEYTPEAAPSAVLGGTETVLIVEDEPLVRDVTRAMLTRRGYNVLIASDGEQALRVARQHVGAINLLLTDVVMPKANGRRVAEQLAMARPGLRVLFMSGYTEDSIVHHGVLEPGISLIEKPFTDLALARRVRELLDA